VIQTLSKPDLRQAMRSRRIELAKANPDAALQAADALVEARLPAFASYAGYHALGAELNPSPLIRRLAGMGAFFALPVCEGPDRPLVFRLWDSRDRLVPDSMGVPAPPAGAQVIHPDLLITPVLAFDRRGGRLGQGGGHYDRSIAALRAGKRVFVLGLAFSGQEVDEVPCDEHDQRLDAVLTEKGYIDLSKA